MTTAVAAALSSWPRNASPIFGATPNDPPPPPEIDLTDPYATKVLAVGSGPRRFWRFDGEDGSPLLCSITEAEDVYTAPPLAFGQPPLPTTTTGGNAVDFGGIGWATAAHVSGDDITEGMVCGWCRATAAAIAGEHWFITKGEAANDVAERGRVIIRAVAGGGVAAVMRDGVSSFVTIETPGATVTDDEPFHVALVLTASGAQLWVDGVFQAATDQYTRGLANNTEPWYIARRVNTGASLDGELDEWAVYSGPITQAEIQSLADYVEPVDPPPDETVGLAPTAVYQFFTESDADTVEVGTIAALRDAVNAAPAGRNILLQPGTYTGGTFTFTPAGAAGNPVVVRPRDGYGTVTINTPIWTINGNNLVISKLYFDNARLEMQGAAQRIRITRCRFRNNSYETINVISGKSIRADHCDYSEYQNVSRRRGFFKFRPDGVDSGAIQNLLADYNYIHDIDYATEYNGAAVLGIENVNTNLGISPGIYFENTLIHNVDLPGDLELIGMKTSGMVLYRLTTTSTYGCYLNLPRQGKRARVLEGWFEGQSNYIRMFSQQSEFVGNRLIGGCQALICPGSRYFDGTRNLTGAGYTACDEVQVVGNIGDVTGCLRVGDSRVANEPTPALATNLWANTVSGGGDPIAYITGKHTGTTLTDPGISYTPAVKLTTADVGPLAP